MEQLDQVLTCCICLDRYRTPKLLPCQHSYCMEPCMRGLVDHQGRNIKCPECRAEHRIPSQGVQALPTNVTLQRLLELNSQPSGNSNNSNIPTVTNSVTANTNSDHVSLMPREQRELKGAAWFQVGLSKIVSEEVLSDKEPGAFIVRKSTRDPGRFVLSVRVPSCRTKVKHFYILKLLTHYMLAGSPREYPSLKSMITYHTERRELLPVRLVLPGADTSMLQHPRDRERRSRHVQSQNVDRPRERRSSPFRDVPIVHYTGSEHSQNVEPGVGSICTGNIQHPFVSSVWSILPNFLRNWYQGTS